MNSMRYLAQYVVAVFSTIVFIVGVYNILSDYWSLDNEITKVIILFGIAIGIVMSIISTRIYERLKPYNVFYQNPLKREQI